MNTIKKNNFVALAVAAAGCCTNPAFAQESAQPQAEEASFRKAVSQYLSILASRTKVEGIALEVADGPLVQ